MFINNTPSGRLARQTARVGPPNLLDLIMDPCLKTAESHDEIQSAVPTPTAD